MDFTAEKSRKINPKLTSNIFGKLMFWWIKDVFWLRKMRDIKTSDVYDVLPDQRSDSLSKKLEISWEKEIKEARKKKVSPSFWKALINTFIFPFLATLSLPLGYGIISILQPLIVKPLMSYFHVGSKTSVIQAAIFGTVMVLLMIVQTLLHCHGRHMMIQLGMNMKIACSSLVFKKISRLSNLTMRNCAEGSIINLISTDASKFQYFLPSLYYTFVTPLQFIIAIYIMWKDIGVIVLVGIAILNMQCLPLLIFLYNVAKKLRVKLSIRRDERITLINEIINGIRTLKIYVWESSFKKMVFLKRSREIDVQMKLSLINALIMIMALFAHRSSAFLTVLTYTLTNSDTLTAEKVVSIIQLLNTLMLTVSVHCMHCSQQIADVNISVKRFQEFLCLEEVHHYVKKIITENDEVSISIKNVTASWDKDSYALQNLSVKITSNKLCCITGIIGSGKSTLLKLILDEFPPTSGEVHVRGRVSYASQEPWLFPASIRDNILLGEEYNGEKYQKVIEACDLTADFDFLPHGDKTLVGHRGMALSGGQCARVNLARAVYKDADIYLLDDPLASVDVHVKERIFQNCINGYLKNKTRLLVTHNIDHLQNSDEIVLMKKGAIEFHSNPDKFNEFIEKLNDKSNFVKRYKSSNLNHKSSSEKPSRITTLVSKKHIVKAQETEELTAKGYIAKSVYWEYISATGSFFLLFILIIGLISSLTMFTIFDYAIVARTKESVFDLNNNTVEAKCYYSSADYSHEEKSLFFCGFLLLAAFVLIVLSHYLYYLLFLKANKNIHNKMFECVIRTPMQFFRMNTMGVIIILATEKKVLILVLSKINVRRILNRFSKDIMIADEIFLKTTINSISQLFVLSSSFISVVIINWWSIFPLLIVVFILMLLTKHFILTTLGFSRLEGNAKSPVLSIITTSISGLLTIRSCKAEKIFSKVFDMRQDHHTSVFYLNTCIGVAHGLCCQILLAAFYAIVVFGSIALKEQIYASDIGYILANMLFLLEVLQFMMRVFADSVAHAISVERMIQYTKLDQEKSIDNKIGIEKSWPCVGELKFIRVYLRYSDDSEPVLKNLTFTVDSGSKIGIVGRTGAGKSSLISALFRLAEIDGSILVDGIDTKHINLSQLRSKISIIPQEPFLFSATLRSNLDPLNEFDDASIWSALRDVELNQTFSSLDHPIEKAGGNLSLGERQLLCLARAIIKKNKILVLDEATANVDSTTDALIQKTIRTKFKDCTVLVIAHRLNTIMASDKILVIDEGEMVEFDRPDVLLQKKNGLFASMVQTSNNNSAMT